MKSITLLLAAITLLSLASCSTAVDDRAALGVHGNVKSFLETQTPVKLSENGRWVPDDELASGRAVQYYFDESGRHTSMEQYQDGNLVETATTHFENGKIIGWTSLDENGNLQGEHKIIEETKRYREVEGYNQNGQLVNRNKQQLRRGRVVAEEISFLGADSEIEYTLKSTREYNRDGTPSAISQTYDGEPSFSIAIDYREHDAQGNWTKSIAYSADEDPAKIGAGHITVRVFEYY